MRYFNIYLILLLLFTSCDDFFEPALENNRDVSANDEPLFVHGLLGNAYILLPYSNTPNNDLATDDAVANDHNNSWSLMATGAWTSSNDPTSQWKNRYNAILYINRFLELVDDVEWAREENIRIMFRDRLKGEAYALRALQMYYLLRAHGGWNDDGELLGVPIKLTSESSNADFNQPRDSFQDCLNQIFTDCNNAIDLLPLDYKAHAESDVPDKYKELGIAVADYDRVNGAHMGGRISGRIVETIRAQVALMAASPAFSEGTSVTWEDAANYAAVVLNRIDGVNGIDNDGNTWYTNTEEIKSLASGAVPQEIIWRSNTEETLRLEQSNYPPSLYGNGFINPTQNLVNAFPMRNGYPITDTDNSGYNETAPYENRDPRLGMYILLNGSTQGPQNDIIISGAYGENADAINRESGYSTRTGYYLRKLLRRDCNPNPQFNTTQKHYTAYIRYTEIFLSFAEAANEAWGPTGGDFSYSAYDIIKAIRKRAGIDEEDLYLNSIKNNQDKMRELIRNERRIELCFEGHRFYDLRRWKVSAEKLSESAKGVYITDSNGSLHYDVIDEVEKRDYKEFMYYGPIPYSETIKYNNLEQNVGW